MGNILPYGHAFGKQTGYNILFLFIKPNTEDGILMAHQDVSRAVTGLVLVFVKGKGLAGQVVLQLTGGRIDDIMAGVVAECGGA